MKRDRLFLDAIVLFSATPAGKASHLLTGDRKHFGAYFNQPELTAGVIVQTVADYLDAL